MKAVGGKGNYEVQNYYITDYTSHHNRRFF
jgi:hypothetical protein